MIMGNHLEIHQIKLQIIPEFGEQYPVPKMSFSGASFWWVKVFCNTIDLDNYSLAIVFIPAFFFFENSFFYKELYIGQMPF